MLLDPGYLWTNLPKQYSFPTRNPSSFVYPPIENRLKAGKDSYEDVNVGAAPSLGRGSSGGGTACIIFNHFYISF